MISSASRPPFPPTADLGSPSLSVESKKNSLGLEEERLSVFYFMALQ